MKINESYKPILKNWLYGIAFYLIPFIIGYLTFRSILSDNVMQTDVESARAFLGALITSEASILAIVVSLSLVAVQLAAQSYSARVIEVFRKAPDLWILMGIYWIAIFYGLGVLKMIENPQVGRLSNLEEHVAFSYYLGVFAFVALVPYMWKMFEMLKPSTVINMLVERITKQSLVSATKEEVEEITDDKHLISFNFGGWAEEGPFSPIIDILHSSMMKYDYETLRIGLRTIKNRINHIFSNETFNFDEERKISIYIFKNLTGVGQLAASRKDEHSILEVITNFQKIGINVAMKELVVATQFSVIDLKKIGELAVEMKFEDATRKIVDSLEYIGRIAALRKIEKVTIDVISALEKLGVAAAEQELEVATFQATKALEEIGILLTKQNLESITKEVASIIGRIGIVAAQRKLEDIALQATRSLEKVGLAATEQESEEVSKQVAFSLGAIGITSMEQAHIATFQVVESLKVIGLAAAKHNFKSSIKQAILSLELVHETAKGQNLVYHESEECLKELNDALKKL